MITSNPPFPSETPLQTPVANGKVFEPACLRESRLTMLQSPPRDCYSHLHVAFQEKVCLYGQNQSRIDGTCYHWLVGPRRSWRRRPVPRIQVLFSPRHPSEPWPRHRECRDRNFTQSLPEFTTASATAPAILAKDALLVGAVVRVQFEFRELVEPVYTQETVAMS